MFRTARHTEAFKPNMGSLGGRRRKKPGWLRTAIPVFSFTGRV